MFIRKRKTNKLKRIVVLLAVLLLLLTAELLYSNNAVTVSRYNVRSGKVTGDIRIVFLSDLHGREFGENNARLLERIEAEGPDIIALVGDMLDKNADEEQIDRVCAFISAAADIAPVYFGMGNHEYALHINDALAKRITAAGAVVLDGSYIDTQINGTPVRLGGYEGYYRTPHLNTADIDRQEADGRFFDEFEDTDRFKLLLNHIPTNWLDWEYRDTIPVDLVLSGHYHGGLIRIPLIEQGVYAPYVGWFPRYSKGVFIGEKAACVLTAGLAGANGIPRFFNPPEIVVVELEAG